MKAAPLSMDHILDLELHTETTQYLREHGYNVNIGDAYSVVSESGNSYLVYVLRTHSKPFVDADAVADQTDVICCTCSSFRYGSGLKDLEDHSPDEYSRCKHGEYCWERFMDSGDDTQTNE